MKNQRLAFTDIVNLHYIHLWNSNIWSWCKMTNLVKQDVWYNLVHNKHLHQLGLKFEISKNLQTKFN
jgi:hypothetical protein